ncbi:hypothetical protein B0H14DRAFT_784936 [Mycena olivaceomarginata]|nr:hypothetical protein B0H14DRAFT_784936 [Mycena olivaceomarginata]
MQEVYHETSRVSVWKSLSLAARHMRTAVLRLQRRRIPCIFPVWPFPCTSAVTDFHGRLFAVPSSRDAVTKPGHPPPSYPSLRIPSSPSTTVSLTSRAVVETVCSRTSYSFPFPLLSFSQILLALTHPHPRCSPPGGSRWLAANSLIKPQGWFAHPTSCNATLVVKFARWSTSPLLRVCRRRFLTGALHVRMYAVAACSAWSNHRIIVGLS